MSDRIASGILIAIAVAFIAMAISIQPSTFSDPLGARWVPILIGIFVIGAGIALLVQPRSTTRWPDRKTASRLLLCLAGFVAYGFALNPLGFIVATTLAFALFAMLFRGTPLRALLAGAVFSVACYLIFSVALDLYLPTGRVFAGWF
jgi:putative tricarboxylic transport membrane protein